MLQSTSFTGTTGTYNISFTLTEAPNSLKLTNLDIQATSANAHDIIVFTSTIIPIGPGSLSVDVNGGWYNNSSGSGYDSFTGYNGTVGSGSLDVQDWLTGTFLWNGAPVAMPSPVFPINAVSVSSSSGNPFSSVSSSPIPAVGSTYLGHPIEAVNFTGIYGMLDFTLANAGDGLWLPGSIDITAASVPVPAAAWLFGSGLLGLIGVARRRAV